MLPFLGRFVLKLRSMFTSGVVFERYGLRGLLGEPVWPSGKQRDLGSNPLRLSFFFKSCGLWTLSYDFVPHN